MADPWSLDAFAGDGRRSGRSGKTTQFVDAIVHFALGEDFICFTVPEPLRVLLIENEGPEVTLR